MHHGRNNWWYSFNIGNAHFVSLNSNAVMDPVVVTNTSRYQWDYPVSVQIEQWQWLQQDLKAADRNRSSAPWIFVFAHFPLYCSGGGDCLRQASYMRNGIPNYTEYAWEKVLQDYKVDIYISGHKTPSRVQRHKPQKVAGQSKCYPWGGCSDLHRHGSTR